MSPTFSAENIGTTTSTLDLTTESVTLTAYPNPTDNSFYLEINGAEQKERLVSVYHLNGRVLYKNTVFDNVQIDVSDWAAGMYIVRVENVFLKVVVH